MSNPLAQPLAETIVTLSHTRLLLRASLDAIASLRTRLTQESASKARLSEEYDAFRARMMAATLTGPQS